MYLSVDFPVTLFSMKDLAICQNFAHMLVISLSPFSNLTEIIFMGLFSSFLFPTTSNNLSPVRQQIVTHPSPVIIVGIATSKVAPLPNDNFFAPSSARQNVNFDPSMWYKFYYGSMQYFPLPYGHMPEGVRGMCISPSIPSLTVIPHASEIPPL